MTDGRSLFIVRFERTHDGGCGDVIDCTQVEELGGLAGYPLHEGVASGGPMHPGVNVAVLAASDHEAITEARARGDAYAHAQ